MSRHLFGLVVTHHGTAANNRGETEGNITTLQKLLWNGEVYTTVSAEAIRFAIRWYWQQYNRNDELNRQWQDDSLSHVWQDPEFTRWRDFEDDDILGFMSARAAAQEGNAAEQTTRVSVKRPRGERPRGTVDRRRGRLEVTRAISLSPFAGDITFNAASPGATPSASKTGGDPVPYGTEFHATRYQYGFALTPEDLAKKERALDVVDAVISLSKVAGNQGRFLFDFSPDSVVFRWTDDFAPRMLYGFILKEDNSLGIPEILRRIEVKDIEPAELVIGGSIADVENVAALKEKGAFVDAGVKRAATEIKNRMMQTL
jgi:CRISPR-associated protein Cst2